MISANALARSSFLILALAAATACGGGRTRPNGASEPVEPSRTPEVVSLLGVPLYAARDTSGIIALADQQLAADPRDLTSLINAGIARASARRFNGAIEMFNRALELYPNEARLYRFRGHRKQTLRKFEDALQDLEFAVAIDSTNFDIYYHLALSHYFMGAYENAIAAIDKCFTYADDPKWQAVEEARVNPIWYRSCMALKHDDDARAAMLDWKYRALRRLGKHNEARRLARGVGEGWTTQENTPYYRALLFYRGIRDEGSTLDSLRASGDVAFVTGASGVAMWHLLEGDTTRARALYDEILATSQWPAFGFIAAEVEVARMRGASAAADSAARRKRR